VDGSRCENPRVQPDQITAGLLEASLPQPEWTHRGHITAAHFLISTRGRDAALALCRERIPLLNAAHGVENSDTGGYHETLTVFYVSAVADAVARGCTLDETLAELDRNAALRWWSEPVLMSVAARRRFVPPDVAAPPFALTV
jgi:hypothetical protein